MTDDSKKTQVVPAPVPAAAPAPGGAQTPTPPPPVVPTSDAGLESRAQPYQTVVPADQLAKTGNAAPPVALAGVPDTPPSEAPLGVGPRCFVPGLRGHGGRSQRRDLLGAVRARRRRHGGGQRCAGDAGAPGCSEARRRSLMRGAVR